MKIIRLIGQAIMLFVILIGGGLAWFLWSTEEPATKAEISPSEKKISDARWACREAIKKSLHNPDSAEWGMSSGNWYQTWPASLDGNIVTVRPEFRASNALGATILSEWICKIQITDDSWVFLNLEQV